MGPFSHHTSQPGESQEEVLIGFGSNQGDPVKTCLRAVEALRAHPRIEVLKVSSLFKTEPVGPVDQDWFVNGVVQCTTRLTPEELSGAVHGIEADFGRVRSIRWGPRTLDLDILSFGERIIDSPWLTLPHPRLHERRFVLIPLVEVAPHWTHPKLHVSGLELLARISELNNQNVQRL